jgi:hypothetical protein
VLPYVAIVVAAAAAAETSSVDHLVLGAIDAMTQHLLQRLDDGWPHDECGLLEAAESEVVGAKIVADAPAAVPAFVVVAAVGRAAAVAVEWNVEKAEGQRFADLPVESIACNLLQSSTQFRYYYGPRKDTMNKNLAL